MKNDVIIYSPSLCKLGVNLHCFVQEVRLELLMTLFQAVQNLFFLLFSIYQAVRLHFRNRHITNYIHERLYPKKHNRGSLNEQGVCIRLG